ncbi:hypothetical protein PQX77_018872 [Marasmius sp. AFHP31]|nr:hypothetical protein PQX77_018872 [Marasmius sp. AFHP31]
MGGSYGDLRIEDQFPTPRTTKVQKYEEYVVKSPPELFTTQRTEQHQKWNDQPAQDVAFNNAKTICLVCFIFEWLQQDATKITEVGYSRLAWKDSRPERSDTHWIVVENEMLLNEDSYLNDEREFGKTERRTQAEVKAGLKELLGTKDNSTTALLFYDRHNDLKALATLLGSPLDYLQDPTTPMPSSGVFRVDTADLFSGHISDGSGRKHGLRNMCKELGIDAVHTHNAGNDAAYTMSAFQKLCELGGDAPEPDINAVLLLNEASPELGAEVLANQRKSEDLASD